MQMRVGLWKAHSFINYLKYQESLNENYLVTFRRKTEIG